MSKDNMEELQRWSMEIVVRPGAYSYGNESACNEQFPLYGRLNALRAALAAIDKEGE